MNKDVVLWLGGCLLKLLAGMIFIAAIAFYCAGCAYISIPVGNERARYFRCFETRDLIVTDPSTGIPVLIYSTDGGGETAKKITEGVVAGAALIP